MKITYNLTVADWVNFQEYYRKHHAPLIGCIEPVIYVLTVLNVIVGTWHFISYGFSVYSVICLVCLGVFIFLLYAKKQSKKNLYEAGQTMAEKNPDAFGLMNMELNEQGIHIASQNQTKKLLWEDIRNYQSNNDYFFLYSKKGNAYILPKRDIASATEVQAILDEHLLKTNKTQK